MFLLIREKITETLTRRIPLSGFSLFFHGMYCSRKQIVKSRKIRHVRGRSSSIIMALGWVKPGLTGTALILLERCIRAYHVFALRYTLVAVLQYLAIVREGWGRGAGVLMSCMTVVVYSICS